MKKQNKIHLLVLKTNNGNLYEIFLTHQVYHNCNQQKNVTANVQMTSKCFKHCGETTRVVRFHLRFELFDVISLVFLKADNDVFTENCALLGNRPKKFDTTVCQLFNILTAAFPRLTLIHSYGLSVFR